MTLHHSAPLFRVVPHRRASDWILGSLGVSFAVASASFAGYMIVVGPSAASLKGSGDFPIFAHFDRRSPAAPVAAQMAEVPLRPDAPAARDTIDFNPTGTIEAKPQPSLAPAPAFPPKAAALPQHAAAVQDFVLRDVFDGKALIEARDQLLLVGPGTRLDGGGEVLAIEKQSGRWVVLTTAGVIGAKPR